VARADNQCVGAGNTWFAEYAVAPTDIADDNLGFCVLGVRGEDVTAPEEDGVVEAGKAAPFDFAVDNSDGTAEGGNHFEHGSEPV
jgi:hypothetical protein